MSRNNWSRSSDLLQLFLQFSADSPRSLRLRGEVSLSRSRAAVQALKGHALDYLGGFAGDYVGAVVVHGDEDDVGPQVLGEGQAGVVGVHDGNREYAAVDGLTGEAVVRDYQVRGSIRIVQHRGHGTRVVRVEHRAGIREESYPVGGVYHLYLVLIRPLVYDLPRSKLYYAPT